MLKTPQECYAQVFVNMYVLRSIILVDCQTKYFIFYFVTRNQTKIIIPCYLFRFFIK